MKIHYSVKYRQPGQILWRKLKRIVADGVLPECRFLRQEDDTLIYISNNAEVVFSPDRQIILDRNKQDG